MLAALRSRLLLPTKRRNLLREGFDAPYQSDPRGVPGLQLWLKADAITGLADGAAVTTWSDSSGNGYDATQSTADNKPLYKTNIVNGQPVVRFDGSNDVLSCGDVLDSTFAGASAKYTAFAVVKSTSVAATQAIWGKWLNTGNQRGPTLDLRLSAGALYGGLYTVLKDASNDLGSRGSTDCYNAFKVVAGVFDATASPKTAEHALWVNGATETLTVFANTGAANAVNEDNTTPLQIGGNGAGGSLLTGDIAEIIIFNRALTANERKAVEAYLGVKYGLTVQAGVDFNRWTLTDTTDKFRQTGGVLTATGGDSTWGNTAIVLGRSYLRRAGLMLTGKVTPQAASQAAALGLSTSGATDANVKESIQFGGNSLTTFIRRAGGAVQVPWTLVNGTAHYGRIVTGPAGTIYYLSTDRITWYPVWFVSTGTDSPLIPVWTVNANAVDLDDVSLDYDRWPTPRFEVPSSSITPTLGSELLTDAGLEGTYTAGLNGQFTKEGTPTVAQSGDVHGGAAAQSVLAVAQSQGVYRTLTVTAGTWYQYSSWAKRSAGTGGSAGPKLGGGWATTTQKAVTSATYAQQFLTERATAATAYIFASRDMHATSFDTIIVDDESLKAITLASTLSLVGDPGRRDGIVTSRWTLTAGTQAGHAIWVDSETTPTYGLFAYHDGVNAKLDKLENGTWTNLISAAATYSAGADLRTVATPSGSDLQVALFYNDALIGSIQTVTPTSYGTKVCKFSTYASNSSGIVTVFTGTP